VEVKNTFFDTLTNLFAKFDSALLHLAVDGIVKFTGWIGFRHYMPGKHKCFAS
jgi:hypothetical protein